MHRADPIVVLGSRVTDGRPGALLLSRLNKALKLAKRMPDAPVIVTGDGEAAVMARYLTERGIDPERIVEEPAATSTNENLENCFALVNNARVRSEERSCRERV